MEPTINQRIVAIIEALGESNNRFAKRIGTSSAVISHIVTGRNKPNIDLLYKILHSLPNVNIQWLVLGQGNMLLDGDKDPDDHPEIHESDLQTAADNIKDSNETVAQDAPSGKSHTSGSDWDQFLNLLEQMLDAQKMAHQSMEHNLATQKQMLQWLRSFLKR